MFRDVHLQACSSASVCRLLLWKVKLINMTRDKEKISGQRENLNTWQESNPWPPEHRAGALCNSRSLVDRAPARCSGGHRFYFCWGLRFLVCPTLVSCWSIHLSRFITELKIRHFYSLISILVIRSCKAGFVVHWEGTGDYKKKLCCCNCECTLPYHAFKN